MNHMTKTFAVALVLVLVLTATGLWAAAAEEEPGAAMEKEMVMDPTTGEMVSAPEFGGTITSLFNPGWEAEHADMWHYRTVIHPTQIVLERMGGGNWGLPRDQWSFIRCRPECTSIHRQAGRELGAARRHDDRPAHP